MNQEYLDRKTLTNHGWKIQKATQYNSGSETAMHSVAKTLVGHFLHHEHGYNVSIEVAHESLGEVDVLAWGVSDRISPIAVECETSPKRSVVEDKLDRYVHDTPIKECHVLNINNLPEEIMPAYKWVASQL